LSGLLSLARSGSDYWANAMSDRLSPPSIEVVTSGTGDIQVIVDPTLANGVGGEDRTNGMGRGVIALNPQYINNAPMMEHLFGHEFGHAFGFADDYNCGAAGTKMVGSVAPDGPFTGSAPTCGDIAAVQRDYRRDESPVLIDLDGGGIRLSSSAGGVCFRFGVNVPRVAWPVTSSNAFLALDRNGNGRIDDASELFGNWTYLGSGVLAENGYQALAELDADGSGWIDAADPAFDRLVLWQDADRDGKSTSAELSSLEDHGISALSVNYKESRRQDQWGNVFRFRAPVAPARSFRYSYDVFLQSEPCR